MSNFPNLSLYNLPSEQIQKLGELSFKNKDCTEAKARHSVFLSRKKESVYQNNLLIILYVRQILASSLVCEVLCLQTL